MTPFVDVGVGLRVDMSAVDTKLSVLTVNGALRDDAVNGAQRFSSLIPYFGES